MRLLQLPAVRQALICGLAFALVAGFFHLQEAGHAGGLLPNWEFRYRDAVTRQGRFNPPDERLVFLGIDSASVSISELDLQTLFAGVDAGSAEARALEIMAGGWPWSREIYGLIAERLLQAGARAVVFDLLFPKPGDRDDAFRAVLEKYPGRIVLGSNFVIEALGAGREGWSLSPPSETILPANAAVSVGYVNFWPGFNGVVREFHYYTTLDQLQGAPPPPEITVETPAALATLAGRAANAPELAHPFQPHLARFTGPPGTFIPLPIYQIFAPEYWKGNFAGGAVFRDRLVVVGPAGNWQHDEHATPFGQMPGPELHLNSLNALLHHAFLREWPRWSGDVLIFAGALLAWLLTITLRKAWLRLGAFVAAGAAYLAVVKFAHDQGVILLAIPPVLAFGASGLGAFIYDYTRETLEKLRVRRTLEAYVSSDVVREVLDNPASYLSAVGGTRVRVALLMTDLRGFTTISERMDSSQLVAQLNEYLSAMIDDIFAVRGSVDKFIGDAILAVWGHFRSSGAEQDTAHAIEAYFRMRTSLERLNAEWRGRDMAMLEMGCGVNFGEVVFGNIGSARKMEPTVIGDPVNVTARLESLTKEYGRGILIGPDAAELVREKFTLQFVDRVAVKGKTKALDLYTVIGPAGENRPAALTAYLEIYERAQRAWQAEERDEAARLFESCLAEWPGDRVASLYLERCRAPRPTRSLPDPAAR